MANPTPGRTFILGLVMKKPYDKNGNISEEEKARIEGIDATIEAIDESTWCYWPTLTEVIEDGRHGTEAELRSRDTGIRWCETLLETEEKYSIPPNVQEIIRKEYPLNKKYEIALIKRHDPRTFRSPNNESFAIVHWLGDKDGDIPIMQKQKFTGGRINSSLVPPPASLSKENELFRHLLFPITKHDWLYKLSEFCQQTNIRSADLFRQKPDIGFYNDFLKPHVECSPRVGKPAQVMISIPIINIKPGQKFRDQKTAERYIRYQPAPLRALGYESYYNFTKANGTVEGKRPIYRWTNALDDTLFMKTPSGGPTVYSARSLFEYRHPRKRTEHLDDRQTIRKKGVNGFSGDDNYICVDQMWAVVIPSTETLVTFQQLIDPRKVLEVAHMNSYALESYRTLEIAPVGPVHEFLLFFGSLTLKTHYTLIDSFRDAASDINFRVSSDPIGDESLIQDCNYLLAELSIIIEITNSQLDVLAGIKNSLIDEKVIREEEFRAASQFYGQLTDRLNVVIGTFKDYKQDGQQAQNLLFQLLSTENAKQQARMSTQQAEIAQQTKEETVIQVRMAERAEEQSKSVLVFTIITTVFLPLSFFTSYYGMDATSAGISDASAFWRISGPASVIIVILAMSLAFRGKIKRSLARALHLGKRLEKINGAPTENDLEKGEDVTKPSKTPKFFFYPTGGQKVD